MGIKNKYGNRIKQMFFLLYLIYLFGGLVVLWSVVGVFGVLVGVISPGKNKKEKTFKWLRMCLSGVGVMIVLGVIMWMLMLIWAVLVAR